jgi:CDP-L-myo-inositol myo-inositolphosphotransferase
VLAAGRSERLREVTGGGSKALVRLGGVALVERAVRGLLHAGVEEVVVVCGYQAGPVAAVVKRIAPGRVRTILARDWQHGNAASLAAAERFVKPNDALIAVVTMDHLFSDRALDELVRAGDCAVLVDPAPDAGVWAEGTRVRLRGRSAVAFGKRLRTRPVDCGAFLLAADIFGAVRESRGRGDHSLAAAVTLFARNRPLRAIELPRHAWWQDIDTPRDLKLAKRRLRSSLVKISDGPVSRYLNRPLSTRMSMPLASLGVPPDLISMASALIGCAGAVLLGRGMAIAAAMTVHLASVLDGVDGEVARLHLRASARGALFDGMLDRVTDGVIVAGIGWWALGSGHQPTVVLVLAVAAATVSMLSMASKDRITALALLPAPERRIAWLFGGRDGRLLLVTIFAALGHPLVALAAIAVSGIISVGVRVAIVVLRSP